MAIGIASGNRYGVAQVLATLEVDNKHLEQKLHNLAARQKVRGLPVVGSSDVQKVRQEGIGVAIALSLLLKNLSTPRHLGQDLFFIDSILILTRKVQQGIEKGVRQVVGLQAETQ